MPLDLAQTLAFGSIEEFLKPEERQRLSDLAAVTMAAHAGVARVTSVHAVDGYTPDEIRRIYEPSDRVEATDLPMEAVEILQQAFVRNLPSMQAIMPSARGAAGWFYVEYGPGQYVTSHIDCVDQQPGQGALEIAALGVPICSDYVGGEFLVETSATDALLASPGPRPDVDLTSPRFSTSRRTTWSCRPEAGTAIVWGGNLAHSTSPVRQGVVRKFIARITA
jgi:hypothetical protein